MRIFKLFIINLLVLFFLTLFIEVGFRTLWTLKQCFGKYTNGCDFKRLYSLKIRNTKDDVSELYLGLTKYDEKLGYIYTPGFKKVISTPINEKYIQDWKNVNLSINNDGYRSNDNDYLHDKYSILAVGDSFTFGSQVNNNETWPSCLERELKLSVSNAGVAGYGAAQSVRRAEYEVRNKKFDTIILGMLLGEDYERDKYIFRWGFPRPALIEKNSKIYFENVPGKNSIGTKYMPSRSELMNLAYSYSQIFTTIYDKILGRYIDITGMRREEIHENAASISQIIKFTVNEFSKLNVRNKFILFQYQLHDFNDNAAVRKNLKDLAEKTRFEAQKGNIKVIDTYKSIDDFLAFNNANKMYQKHHTAFGNNFVCKIILENL
jgi:hypothetical protein